MKRLSNKSQYSYSDWEHEVMNGKTELRYQEWVELKTESDAFSLEVALSLGTVDKI